MTYIADLEAERRVLLAKELVRQSGIVRMKSFALGIAFALAIVGFMVYVDPMISAHVYCAVTQNERCI